MTALERDEWWTEDHRDIPHGTVGAYSNRRCRCAECTAAVRVASAARLERRRIVGLRPLDDRHGTLTGYKGWGCRCEACVAAKRAYDRSWAREYRKSRARVDGGDR